MTVLSELHEAVRVAIETAGPGMDSTLVALVVEAVEPFVMSNVSAGNSMEHLTRQSWKQMYDREHAQRVEADKYTVLLFDLDRCEHGRHEGDVCGGESGCNGPSKGNPLSRIGHGGEVDEAYARLWSRFGESSEWPDRLLGFTMSARPIVYPERVLGKPMTAADFVVTEGG